MIRGSAAWVGGRVSQLGEGRLRALQTGFGVPIEQWPRDWAEALLNEKRLREDGILAPGPIRQMWQQHVGGQRRWHYHLWDVLMLQAWLDGHAVSA